MQANGGTLAEKFVVEAPSDVALPSDTGVSGDSITVTGSYFGSKCPKVTMAFTDAKG